MQPPEKPPEIVARLCGLGSQIRPRKVGDYIPARRVEARISACRRPPARPRRRGRRAEVPVSIQSIEGVTLTSSSTKLGAAWTRVGHEPSGSRFNSMSPRGRERESPALR